MVFVCVEKRPSEKSPINGMTESTVNFAGSGDGTGPGSGAAPVPGHKSPVYAINGHSLRSNNFSAHRFGSTYGSFSNSCLGTSLSSMRLRSETATEARASPLASEFHI